MKTVVVFLISLLFSIVALAQDTKYFHTNLLSSKAERTVVLSPIADRNIKPVEILRYTDDQYDFINYPQWDEMMADLYSRVFEDLPLDRKEFLNRVFVVVKFNKEGEIGNEILFIPRGRFDEIMAYEENLYQYILELRKIDMRLYADISNPATFRVGTRRIKLYE